jgi:hypothetical protein
MRGESICFWVIFKRPDDFPNHYVLRRQYATRGAVVPDPIAGLYNTIEEARFDIPDGLLRLPRDPADYLAIVESWF